MSSFLINANFILVYMFSKLIYLLFHFYSHKLLRSPKKVVRKISKVPYKVLDAPDLQV